VSAIIIPPRSLSNPSNMFRVAEYSDWLSFRNGSATDYEFTEHSSHREAAQEKDDRNLSHP